MKFNSCKSFFVGGYTDSCQTVIRLVFQHEMYDDAFLVVKFRLVGGYWRPLNMKIWRGSLQATIQRWTTKEELLLPASSLDSLVLQAREFSAEVAGIWFLNETFV